MNVGDPYNDKWLVLRYIFQKEFPFFQAVHEIPKAPLKGAYAHANVGL